MWFVLQASPGDNHSPLAGIRVAEWRSLIAWRALSAIVSQKISSGEPIPLAEQADHKQSSRNALVLTVSLTSGCGNPRAVASAVADGMVGPRAAWGVAVCPGCECRQFSERGRLS